MADIVLRISGLGKRADNRPVLDGLDMELESGKIAALLGSSGSGKTLLLRILGGLVPADAGSAEICGISITQPESRKATGMVIGDPAIRKSLSVAGNLEYQGRLLGKVDRKRIGTLMKALEILPRQTGNRRAGSCPAGIRQRLGVAMALLGEPRLLILDDLYAGLDTDDALRMTQLIREEAASKNMAVLLTGAFLSELWPVSDEFLLLGGGSIRAKYQKEELAARLPEGAADGQTLENLYRELQKEAGL